MYYSETSGHRPDDGYPKGRVLLFILGVSCGFTPDFDKHKEDNRSNYYHSHGGQLRLFQTKKYDFVIPPEKHDDLTEGIAENIDEE
jgi:hypothetical protein